MGIQSLPLCLAALFALARGQNYLTNTDGSGTCEDKGGITLATIEACGAAVANGYTPQDVNGNDISFTNADAPTDVGSNAPLGCSYDWLTRELFWGTSTADTLPARIYLICSVPTDTPSKAPTGSPTKGPTKSPTKSPTQSPSKGPTELPSKSPSRAPTKSPTRAPTDSPTRAPTDSPTRAPTNSPTKAPSRSPTQAPSGSPTNTDAPSFAPTVQPTDAPSTLEPSLSPTTPFPTDMPTNTPTSLPTPPTASMAPTFEYCPAGDDTDSASCPEYCNFNPTENDGDSGSCEMPETARFTDTGNDISSVGEYTETILLLLGLIGIFIIIVSLCECAKWGCPNRCGC